MQKFQHTPIYTLTACEMSGIFLQMQKFQHIPIYTLTACEMSKFWSIFWPIFTLIQTE